MTKQKSAMKRAAAPERETRSAAAEPEPAGQPVSAATTEDEDSEALVRRPSPLRGDAAEAARRSQEHYAAVVKRRAEQAARREGGGRLGRHG